MYGSKTEKYFELVMGEMKADMTLDKKSKRELGKAVLNTIFDTGGATKISKRPTKKSLFVANKIFRPMSEIMKTIEAIENVSIYIRTFPYKKYQISSLSYLQYHVENYLNEIYILKNRLISYLNILEKTYSKTELNKEIARTIKPLYPGISTAFRGYVDIRGGHVHELRYSDKDFDKLSTLELFARLEDKLGNISRHLYRTEYHKVRKKWTVKIKTDLKAINQFLDYYFEQLASLLFKSEALFIPPHYI